MRAAQTASRLEGFAGRGGGTDAERRAARWLADEIGAAGRESVVEPFWCRPSWAFAHAWHVALAIAGSLVAVASARVGGAMLLAALVFVILDELTGASPGRRLTPERASQNVIALPPPGPIAAGEGPRITLILTANYDAGRIGIAYRDAVREATARLRHAMTSIVPGWLGWLLIAIVWLLAIAILRLDGHRSMLIGAVQLPPTVALVLALALLLDLATGNWSPSAGDNGSGVGVVLELARALDAGPPGKLDVEVVLAGAGDGGGIGLRRYLRAHRHERTAANTIVIGVAPCGDGSVRWWVSDGALVPLAYAAPLRQRAAAIAPDQADTRAQPHHGRGATPAFRARMKRIPAIAIGCLDERGIVPRSHAKVDSGDSLNQTSLEQAVQFALMLVDAIDAELAQGAASIPRRR
jgi:hypothetical protein